MLRTTEKAVLITACVAGIALAFLLWNPYAQVSTLSLEYVRGQAVKWARCIEERTPFTLDVPALVSQETVTIRVDLPNEQPLVVTATKSKLRIPCPEASGGVLVYGPPTTWSGERKAKVYQEEGYVVVELVPRVQIMASSESGARVYIVRVELFRLDLSQVEARKTIGPKGVQELPYARGYDYSGTSRVYLNNELVGQLSVVKGDGVRVVVAYELWS
jgi:hypothetical protein